MSFTKTDYGELPKAFFARLQHIQLLVCDVDGVFSDGRIYLGNQGEEFKAFHTRDGFGVKALVKAGVRVAVITGRQSQIVTQRMRALDVEFVLQGVEDKRRALYSLRQELGLHPDTVASVGDDVPDMGMYQESGIKIAVNDAHPQVLKAADWITTMRGGMGAVREICDTLLQARGASVDNKGVSL